MLIDSPNVTGSLVVDGDLHLPSGTTAQRPLNPLTGSLRFNSDSGSLEIFNGLTWSTVQGGAAEEAPLNTDIEYLLVAGGGGGGGVPSVTCGGGGAGGLLSSSLASVQSGSTFTVTVGAGGVKASGNGNASLITSPTISTITAVGGGLGSTSTSGGANGGSGGGAGNGASNVIGGSGTQGQGNDGGNSSVSTRGAGGGGAGEKGFDSITDNGGAGGDGVQSSITGTSKYYAGGGGGAGGSVNIGGAGGQGGGGQGESNNSNNTTSGTPNTGGGGGGSFETATNGAGGSGVAIFAYDSGSFNAAGGIVGDAGNGRKYNQFNTSGTFKVGSPSDFGIVTDSLGLHLDAGNFASRGTSTAIDLSTNTNNLAVTGASLDNNYYYSISGTSTYLSCASDASIKNTTALTLEAWIRLTDLTNEWKPIFSKGNSDAVEDYILMARPGNNVIYFDCGGGSLYAQPSFTWASNTWYHVVATHSKPSGTSTMGITINNSALSVTTNGATGAAGNTTDSLYIGTARNNSIGGTGIQIAQARIYTKILSAAEITQNYNATKTNFV